MFGETQEERSLREDAGYHAWKYCAECDEEYRVPFDDESCPICDYELEECE